ncbi:MAG: hypothetical protein AAFX87_03415 [Bacteroidota bacterium]
MTSLLFVVLFFFEPLVIEQITGNFDTYLLIIVIMTYVLPLISMLIMKLTTMIPNFQMTDRRERIYPYIFTITYYIAATYFFNNILSDNNVNIILLMSTVSLCVAFVVNFYFKISIHSIAICGVLGFMSGLAARTSDILLIYPIAGLVVLAGALMSSRLLLNAHNTKEVYAGALLGLFAGFTSSVFLN